MKDYYSSLLHDGDDLYVAAEKIWSPEPDDNNLLLDGSSIFYARSESGDFPPLPVPEFPTMSSSSSSTSFLAPATAVHPTVAAVAMSTSSPASSESSHTNNNNNNMMVDTPSCGGAGAMSYTTSMDQLPGLDSIDFNIDGMDDFDLLMDPLFDGDHHGLFDGFQEQDGSIVPVQPVEQTTVAAPPVPEEDLREVFLEWLKNNKENVSADDLRQIKIKKSTVDSATKRLGGGKEGMKKLLKLILEWVQTNHLRRRRKNNDLKAEAEVPAGNFDPTPTPPAPSYDNYQTAISYPDPVQVNVNPWAAASDTVVGYPCSLSSDPFGNYGVNYNFASPVIKSTQSWPSSQFPPAPPAHYAAFEGLTQSGGFSDYLNQNQINQNQINQNQINQNLINHNLINHNLINQNLINQNLINQNLINQNLINQNLINQNLINQNQINQNQMNQNQMNQNQMNQNQMNQNQMNQNQMNQNQMNQNQMNQNLYPCLSAATADQGGGGGDNNNKLLRLGPSATKEARKKRMARHRSFIPHRNHHHKSAGGENERQFDPTLVQQQQQGNLVDWSLPLQAGINGPTAAAGSVLMDGSAVDQPAMQNQNNQKQGGAEDKQKVWKAEKNLKFLLQKVLKQSDVGSLGRIVLPKKEAEMHLPELEARDGISITMEDIGTSRVWNMRYRFWPNNKSRMYLLENTGNFVRANGLKEGDFVVIYSDVKCGKYLIRGVKVRQPATGLSKPESKKAAAAIGSKSQRKPPANSSTANKTSPALTQSRIPSGSNNQFINTYR
ncbi:B3 domain-containing transcription factor ABI3 [Linum perenne]